jgi:hypothetical protein
METGARRVGPFRNYLLAYGTLLRIIAALGSHFAVGRGVLFLRYLDFGVALLAWPRRPMERSFASAFQANRRWWPRQRLVSNLQLIIRRELFVAVMLGEEEPERMISCPNSASLHRHFKSKKALCLIAFPIFQGVLLLAGTIYAQTTQSEHNEKKVPPSIHGTVLNRLTGEPVGRALVFSPDRQFATLTDERGHFEFELPQEMRETAGRHQLGNTSLLVKKPGFLGNENQPATAFPLTISELTLYLVPESLIVGHVHIPESEGETRIHLELYRKDVSGGKERWQQTGTFTTWADGEFRFSELPAGTYKLSTAEALDRDPLVFSSGAKQFGYPPTYFPSATDFAGATPLQLATGVTLQADMTVTRREYHEVKIAVASVAAAQQPINVQVYPLGHPGPGYSLGYNPEERQIQGMLPDGNYTLKAELYGPTTMTGVLSFSVRGAALEGPSVNLIPDGTVVVKVNEEFSSEQGSPQGSQGNVGSLVDRGLEVQVNLLPVDEFSPGRTLASEPNRELQDGSKIIRNISPGQYRVQAWPSRGFVASVQSNGKDLVHELLTVGMGGTIAPIEITVRDGAALLSVYPEFGQRSDNSVQAGESRQVFIYVVPLDGGEVQENILFVDEQNPSVSQYLRPGSYRVLAFDRHQQGLDFADQEELKRISSKGQVIELTANQKQQVRANVIREDNSE